MNVDPSHPETPGRAISILGASLDVGNRGVLALGVSLVGLFSRLRPGAEIVFHYGNETGGVRRLAGEPPVDVQIRNCRVSPKSEPSEHIAVILALALLHRIGIRGPARRNVWLRSLLDAELVGDIRGGDSFSDIYGFRRFLEGSLPLLSAMLLRRRYILLPQTYGPFRSPGSRWLASRMVRAAAIVLTRDRNCEKTVMELSGSLPRFCPDVAFTLDPMRPAEMAFSPSGLDIAGRPLLVGVNVSGLLYMGGYTGRNMFGLRSSYREMIDELVDRLLTTTASTVLLIPHTFGEEREEEACSAILESAAMRHPGRVFMLTSPLNEREIKWLIGQTSFFIGSRMHACIAALSQTVPAIGLAYSDKFLGVFASAGVDDSVIDLRSADTSELLDRTMEAFERREMLAARLRSRIPRIQEEVFAVFRGLSLLGD